MMTDDSIIVVAHVLLLFDCVFSIFGSQKRRSERIVCGKGRGAGIRHG
jgi:hypothetical protein